MSQGRNWMVTINNPHKADAFEKWATEKAKYFIYQYEKGEKGTLHIQGYIIFKGNQRISTLKKLHATAHWELRMGTHEQARKYCTKSESRVKPGLEWGEPPAQGKRSDLLKMKETIDANPSIKMEEVFDKHFSVALRYSAHIKEYIALKAIKRNWKTEVTVIWGPPGVGKTSLCHQVSPDAYVKDCTTKWWDNYDGVSDVIFDDFYGGIQYTTMLALLDRYHCQVECKGGVINFAPKRIFITSNKKYSEWYGAPEGTDMNFQATRVAAIERRIDNLLTMEELGKTFVVKGVIPTLPVAEPVPEPPKIDEDAVVPKFDNIIVEPESEEEKDESEESDPEEPSGESLGSQDTDEYSEDSYEEDEEPRRKKKGSLKRTFRIPEHVGRKFRAGLSKKAVIKKRQKIRTPPTSEEDFISE